MHFQTLLVAFTLATIGMANPVVKRTGTDPSTPKPKPEDCATRDDGNTSPKFCPNLGVGAIVVPVSLCSIIADINLGLNLLSCCGESSCVVIDIL